VNCCSLSRARTQCVIHVSTTTAVSETDDDGGDWYARVFSRALQYYMRTKTLCDVIKSFVVACCSVVVGVHNGDDWHARFFSFLLLLLLLASTRSSYTQFPKFAALCCCCCCRARDFLCFVDIITFVCFCVNIIIGSTGKNQCTFVFGNSINTMMS